MNNHCSIGRHSRTGGNPVKKTILRSRQSHVRAPHCGGYGAHWIPASAGMTAQHGFSIVSAIFLLVVLSFLGVAMVTFSTTQHQSSAMDVMGSRAYQAARAGVEWAAHHVTISPASSPAAWTGCAASQTVAVGGTLAPFSPVNVDCNATSHIESGSTVWVYDITSTARTGGVPGDASYIERVISVKMGK